MFATLIDWCLPDNLDLLSECLKQRRFAQRIILSMAFSADGSQMVLGFHDKTIAMLEVSDSTTVGQVLGKTDAHSSAVVSVAFSPDGTKIVSGSADMTIKVWDVGALRALKVWDMDTDNRALLSEKADAHSKIIFSVAFSLDGTKIVSGSRDGTIKVWDSATLGLLGEMTDAHSNGVTSVAFAPDGTRIVSGSDNKTLKVWDSGDRRLSSEKTDAHGRSITSVAFSPDGTKIVSGSRDRTVKVWECGTLELLSEKPNPYDPPIGSVAFSRDGTKIVAGFQDRTFKAWKVFTWSRQDHSRFNATTQRIVLWVLWLNKHHMKFPDDVLDLLIEACLRS
eukprot:jgi/Chrpa1/13227/Chrysochromulina_OHIO_Genome00014911-RA